jgi:hypothetical protein
MLSRIGPDQIQKIMNISAGDANKFGSNIYHELDKALQSVFPTTQEMAEAKKLVKAGVSGAAQDDGRSVPVRQQRR